MLGRSFVSDFKANVVAGEVLSESEFALPEHQLVSTSTGQGKASLPSRFSLEVRGRRHPIGWRTDIEQVLSKEADTIVPMVDSCS